MSSPVPAVSVIQGADPAACLLDPVRRRLVERLAEPGSATQLARALGLPRQRVNYHLRELERSGLVRCIEERRKGNCTERVLQATARAYVISPEVLGGLGAVVTGPSDRESASALIGAAVETIRGVSETQRRADREGKRLATLTLETEIRFASPEARAAFGAELTTLIGELAARYHDETAAGGRAFRLMVGAHPARSNLEEERDG